MLYFKPRAYRKQPLCLYEIGVRSLMKSDNFVKRYLYYGQIDMPRSEAVKEKRPIILNDYELPRTNESQIMAIETIFLNSETSELKKRVKFLGSTRGGHGFKPWKQPLAEIIEYEKDKMITLWGGADGLGWDFSNGGLMSETKPAIAGGLAFWVELAHRACLGTRVEQAYNHYILTGIDNQSASVN
ncbi:hypothetical protein FXO37_09830 [Capsicum annuum]|nr:hypothetical protein FXO37_09830 [Capsicum annuum]